MSNVNQPGERYWSHLTRDILPFWIEHGPDVSHGGFYGGLERDGKPLPALPKGLVQHARFLWSFSAAYRLDARAEYREMADRAFNFLCRSFYDPAEQGWFYLVSADGVPLDRTKHLYGQSFVIYGLSEYYLATDRSDALALALETFHTIDRAGHDSRWLGYNESFSAQWQPVSQHPDLGVSGDRKTMNTHIHLLESFTSLYRATGDSTVGSRLGELIDLCVNTIVDPGRGHTTLYFERDWTRLPGLVSYGHDIELSWLLTEAAHARGYVDGRAAENCSLWLADAVRRDGLDTENGGLFYEGQAQGQPTARQKVWWVQAEGLVGFLNAHALSGDKRFREAFQAMEGWVWSRQVDTQYGEWHNTIEPDGTVSGEKGGVWKTPYHTGRACMELVRRLARPCTTEGS